MFCGDLTTNYLANVEQKLDMFIIFKGGSGTISELGSAWVLAKLYYGHHKPFILFGEFWKDVIGGIKKGMSLDDKEISVFKIVSDKKDVIPTIKEFEQQLLKVDHSHCQVCKEKAFMT
jgi:predicted Rossmann-fold nucleotide-binding protein